MDPGWSEARLARVAFDHEARRLTGGQEANPDSFDLMQGLAGFLPGHQLVRLSLLAAAT